MEIPGLGLYFPEAIQSDLTARARALNTLVQAGLTLEGALKAVGIVGFDDYIAPLPADDEFGV